MEDAQLAAPAWEQSAVLRQSTVAGFTLATNADRHGGTASGHKLGDCRALLKLEGLAIKVLCWSELQVADCCEGCEKEAATAPSLH